MDFEFFSPQDLKISQNTTLLQINANDHLLFFKSIITLFSSFLSVRGVLPMVSLLVLKIVLLK